MSVLKGLNVVFYNVSDYERARKFYRDTLGLNEFFTVDEAGWAEYGGSELPRLAINLWQREGDLPMGGGATAVFTVDDAEAAIAALRAKGVKCDDPMLIPGMVTLGSFYDPDGNLLQVAQSLVPDAQG